MFRQMECFVLTASLGSFAKAAEQLYLSAPAVSRQIGLLEARIGVQLVERSNKGISLTKAGKVFYDEAVCILNRTQQAIQKAREASDLQEIVLGVLDSMNAPIISKIYPQFVGSNKHYRVSLRRFDFRQVENCLIHHDADVCLVYGRTGSRCEQIEYRMLFCDLVVACVDPASELAKRESISFRDFRNEQVMMISPGCSDFHDSLCAELKLKESSISVYRTNDDEMTNLEDYFHKRLVPCFGASKLLKSCDMYTVKPLLPPMTIELGALYRKEDASKLAAFLDELERAFQDL